MTATACVLMIVLACALVTVGGAAWALLETWALFPGDLPVRRRVATAARLAFVMLFPPGLGAVVMATLGHRLHFEALAAMVLDASRDDEDDEVNDG